MLKKIACLGLLLVVGALVLMRSAAAAPEILTAEQLRPGMQGEVRTVVEGTRIDTFSIEILGVMAAGKSSDGRIVAKASGALIDQTDGVLQGMSGSPVYVDGKLIGAVSGGWKDIDKRTCIITPIADMLKLWELPDLRNQSRLRQVDLKKAAEAAKEPEKMPELDAEPLPQAQSVEPLAAPLFVTGFSPAGLRLLRENLQPFHIEPYAAQAADGQSAPARIEPGGSVGVQVVRGDISMAAIGTVTAVVDGKVLAFGHPFLRRGNVNYFMTDAEILTTATGASAGFKIGTPGRVVGRINQDRSSGVAGVLGQYPSVVPLRVTVEDAQLGRKSEYAMQIAYDESLLAALVPSLVYNAIDSAIDRVGTGTAQVSFEIMTNEAKDGKFTRDNMFYHVQDVGQLAVGEILQTFSLLGGNASREADIVGVKVRVKIDEERRTASIVEAAPDKPEARPGETVQLKVKLKPYRRAEETVTVPYTIPQHQADGRMDLEVRGGGLVPVALLLLQQQGIDLSAAEDKMVPLSMRLQQLAESNRNNELIVAAAPALPESADRASAAGKSVQSPDGTKASPLEGFLHGDAKQATNYIIDNAMPLSIKIKKN